MGPFQDEAERLKYDSDEVYDMRMLKAMQDGHFCTNLQHISTKIKKKPLLLNQITYFLSIFNYK